MIRPEKTDRRIAAGFEAGRSRTGRAGQRRCARALAGKAPPGILASDFLLPSDGEAMFEHPLRVRRGVSPLRPHGGSGW